MPTVTLFGDKVETDTRLTILSPAEEEAFQKEYTKVSEELGLNPNPDDPLHFYDYRGLFKRTGSLPFDKNTGHFTSKFKLEEHPNLIVDGINTKTGQRVLTMFGDPTEPEDVAPTFPDPEAEDQRIKETLDASEELGLSVGSSKEIADTLDGQKIERPGFLKRGFFGFVNKAFVQPFKNIIKGGSIGKLDADLEALTEIRRIKEEEGREISSEEFVKIMQKSRTKVEKRIQAAVPALELPPAKGVVEKGIEITTGVGAFVTKLAVARKFVGGSGTVAEIATFEAVNIIDDGTPGMGVLLASSLGLVGKIPVATAIGRAGKTAAQGGVLASITAAEGGNPEDIAVAFFLPATLRTLRQFPHLVRGKAFEAKIAKDVQAKGFTAKDSKSIAKSVRDAAEVRGGTMSPRVWGAKHGKNLNDIRAKYNKAIDSVTKRTKPEPAIVKKPAEAVKKPPTVPIPAPKEAVAGRKAEKAPVAKGKPLTHSLAQGKTHQEMADMDLKEYADTIHNPAADRLDKVKQRQKELREQGGNYTKTEEWQQLKKEQAQLFEITGGSAFPQVGVTFHERQVEREAIAPTAKPKAVGVAPEKIIHKIRKMTPEEIAEDKAFWENFDKIKKAVHVPTVEALKDTISKRIDLLEKVKLGILTQQEADTLTRKFAEAAKLRIEAKEIKDVEKEAITEPPESPKVDTGKARKFVPTGKLDPTSQEDALEITKKHAQWVAGATKFEPRNVWEGIRETKTEWDEKAKVQKFVTTSVEYTPEQIDTAYRTIQKPVPSPMPDTDLFAMPGKEVQMKAIAQKMAKVKGVMKPKKRGPKLTKPTALPKAKTKKEDHIKAVYAAAAKESERYNITGVKVEGNTLIATDGRRMFWAKGEWGKDGLYLDVAALKKGLLGKPFKPTKKEKINFPKWKEIVPEVSKRDAILVEDLETILRHVRQAASITSEETKGILIIENKDGSLGFSAATPEVGHVEINVMLGGRILGGVNPRFLMDAIRFHAIRGDTAFEFYFKNFDRPILTKSLDGKTNTVTSPINVGEPSEAIKKAISEWPIKAEPIEKPPRPPKPRTAGFLGMPVEFPEPEVAREIAERIYQNYINRFASIENAVKKAKKFGLDVLPGEDPALRARSYLGLGRKVEVILEKNTYRTTKQGNVEMTGEGLKPILDSYENATKTLEPSRKKREKDFNDYLIATRTVEDLQRKAFEGTKKNIASKKQVAEAQERLDKLAKDYGEKGIAIFEEHAQRLYEYQKRVLHLLVDAGNLSQKQFNQITELNQHYIPFDRIMDEQIIGGVPIVKKRFTKARAPIGRIKGSELEVEDTMESIIKNTYRIVDAADRNAVAANLAKLAGTLPDKISPVRVKMIPIRIDPKEILTISREFRSQSSKIMDEVRTITEEGGVNLTGPAKKLEKVVKDALTHRGFSEAEANSFVLQIKKGEPITGEGITKETLRQTIRETQHIIITQEPVESIIFRPSQFAPKGKVIEYFVKGKRKYVDLSGNLFDAMTGLNETSASVMIKVLAKPAHWLRVGATITPEFIAKNPIRDQWTALMQTSFGFTPFVDPAGAVADIIGKSDIYNEWLASGGAYSGFVELNRPALKKSVKELRKPKIRKLLGKLNIISDAQDLSQLMEMATRLGAFKAARRKGLTGIEAGFESREASIDFARRGAKMGDFNRLMAFFNAGVQGLDKTIRTTINHPYQTAVKGIIAITIPTLLLYLRNRKEEDYVELAQWKKDLFWNFKIGDNWWRIPKPFLFGQLFGSIPERFFEFADTKDVKAFDDLAKTAIDSVTPVSGDPEAGLLFTALKPIIENMANWNFFLQRPIVPRAKEELLPPEQFTRYTSETAKQLGRWLDYSPAKIENLVRGYFGGTGQYALQGTDVLINGIRRAAGEKVMPKRPKQLADIPLVKSFVHRPPTGSVSRSVNDFYESTDVIMKGWNTIRLMQKEGRRTEIQGLLATNPEIRLHSSMTKFRTKMSELSKRSDIILKQDISTEIKRQKIRKIDDQKLELAKKANDMIRKAQEKTQ